MREIATIHTSCKNCIFAIYENITQFDCKIKKLDMWKKNNVQVLEAYDEEKEFFIINNRKCPYKRTTKWANAYPKDKHIEQVEKEVTFKYNAIVIASDNIDNIKSTITNLANQKIKPQFITLIRPFNNSIRPSSIVPFLQNINIKWKMVNVADSDANVFNIIDTIVTFSKQPYYVVLYDSIDIPDRLLDKLNEMTQNATPFVLVQPKNDIHGLVVHSLTHKLLRGNKGDIIIDKIIEFAKENTTDQLVYKLDDICS